MQHDNDFQVSDLRIIVVYSIIAYGFWVHEINFYRMILIYII